MAVYCKIGSGPEPPPLFEAAMSDWAAKLLLLVAKREPAVVRASSFSGHDSHYGTPAEESADHLVMAQLLWY